jgi:hypothetical protein
MKNIIKTVIVMFASISLFSSASNAGELGVSGTAKATYNILSGASNKGKGLGITNELNFTASGELDNGYTWSYSMELDPGATAAATDTTATDTQSAQNDDTKLTLTTPYGTAGVFISEGGLDVEDAASQSVYGRPTDIGDPSSGAGDNYTIDAYNNVQYHTPAGLIPYGTSFKIAYAPDLETYGSGNNSGAVYTIAAGNIGDSATEVQIKVTEIPMADGLTIGASYMEFDGSYQPKVAQAAESGAYYATYATGPFSVGYSQAYKAPNLADNASTALTDATAEYYDQTNYSIAYAATDNLSVSYEVENDEVNYVTKATAEVEQKSKSVQIAYTMGGMTLAVAHGSYDNSGYVADVNVDQTLFAVTMAF